MNELNIKTIIARQIIDSRGNPTVETDVTLEGGAIGRAAVPSGASTGSGEAIELRDNAAAYGGKGVTQAIANIHEQIAPALAGHGANDQTAIDQIMRDLDGTDNKSHLGANAILAVSLATAKAVAMARNIPLHTYIATLTGTNQQTLPLPMMNLENGGAHAAFATDIQEYMVIPRGAKSIEQAIQMGAEVFHALAQVLKSRNYPTTVGDEGGYAPRVAHGNREPLDMIMEAIRQAGYAPGEDVVLGLDVASSEFYRDGMYHLLTENRDLTSAQMVDWIGELVEAYPIVSVEDGCSESDWKGWHMLCERLGERVQLVGDDLLVTNTILLRRAIDEKAANAILIKPNQIGSLTETIQAVKMAQTAGWRTVMSHRSGETEDTTIAHLAVGLGCGQIKTGSLSRSERIAKYNELLRIAEADPGLPFAKPFNS